MKNHSISRRYAKVLFDLDCIQQNLEKRLEDFKTIIKILEDNPKLGKFLKSPQMTIEEKKKVLENSLKDTFDLQFVRFLSYLIRKDRLGVLKQIAAEYKLFVNRYLDSYEANLVTAVPIDADSEEKLLNKLEKRFHKKIHLNKKIDPQIIGGAILIFANEMLDWSVKGRLRKIKDNLIANHV